MSGKIQKEDPCPSRMFVMRGGPADGMLLRLYRCPPIGQAESGWELLQWGDEGRYVLGDKDPWTMPAPSRVNKGRTNVPEMLWREAAALAA